MTALETRVKKEINDPEVFPEVQRVAEVRRGLELCPEEAAFLEKRKLVTRDGFARYLGLNPEDVHPDDIPTISFGGSGGGFRAMIGTLGYCDEMMLTGLWDCITYVSVLNETLTLASDSHYIGVWSFRLVLVSCGLLHHWTCKHGGRDRTL